MSIHQCDLRSIRTHHRAVASVAIAAIALLASPAPLRAQSFPAGTSIQPFAGAWLGTTGLQRASDENRLGGVGGVEIARRVAPRLRAGVSASYVRVNNAMRLASDAGNAFVYDREIAIVSLGGDYLVAGGAATRATLGAALATAWERNREAARIGAPRPALGTSTQWSTGLGVELRAGVERDVTPRAALTVGLRGYVPFTALRVSPALTLGVRLR